jgi:cysteine desulfurase
MRKIYLDYASTSATKKEVLKAMVPYFSENFGNASSIHKQGRVAKKAIEISRRQIAKFFNCMPSEIIFTSGGTESDNLAIKGFIESIVDANDTIPHVITSAFEHHAVLDTVKYLDKRNMVETSYIKPGRNGIVSLENIKREIRKNTRLISIMYVNNEIGTIQPIEKIGKYLQIVNRVRKDHEKIVFHTDAVQAVEYLNCDTKKLYVDMMSVSAHKFGGPKGVGFLYLRKGVDICRQNIGGAQENHLRGGTYNTPAIVGMGKAIEILKTNRIKNKIQKILKLRNHMIDRILKEIPDTFLNGDLTLRSPNNVNVSFKYIEGEAILIHLDQAGIFASSGSACTSGSLDPSHVLISVGLRHEDAHGSIRFTLGEMTTKKDIDYTIEVLKKTVIKLRSMSPFS